MQKLDPRDPRFDGPWKSKSKRLLEHGRDATSKRKAAAERQKYGERARQTAARSAAGYEEDVPRCENCKHFKRAGTVLVNSLPRRYSALCKLHDFRVKTGLGCCDSWHGNDGSELAD